MAQTAFQWFIEQLKRYGYYGEDFIFTGIISSELIEQAKQIEKEQIIKSNRDGVDMAIDKKRFITGEQYYNETYGTEINA